ncbi:helix-turn-helix domain-containing protein [Anaeromicropila populeti]|uniref:helix-turn-helix domain-containing protein n=1 Tax=Anaeromicropila populeti TaxID=37658 RepID=UPI0038B8165F
MEYHIRLLLEHLYYLMQSVMSIGAIAEICGYKNEIHFSRQFKKYKGLSPREFREKMSAQKAGTETRR